MHVGCTSSQLYFLLVSLSCTHIGVDAPFTVSNTTGKLDVRGTYYGMLLFKTALGSSDAIVYKPRVITEALRLKVWATIDKQRNEQSVIVIHKSNEPDVPVTVRGTRPGKAQLIVMTAPSMESVHGDSIAGLTFDDSEDGLPHASTYVSQVIESDANGVFSFTARKGSATLLKMGDPSRQLIQLEYTDDMAQIVKNGGGKRGNFIPGLGRNGAGRLCSSLVVVILGTVLFFF